MDRINGKVKFFDTSKGFGFVTATVDGKYEDFFVHVRNVSGTEVPSVGDSVSFRPSKNDKGPLALELVIVKKTGQEVTGHTVRHIIRKEDWRTDGIVCRNCKKNMVPKIRYQNGHPEYSFCPFCLTRVQEEKNGCFIATEIYGDWNAPEVIVLREFRDGYLASNSIGRVVVKLYYATAPAIATWLSERPTASLVVRAILNRLVCLIR